MLTDFSGELRICLKVLCSFRNIMCVLLFCLPSVLAHVHASLYHVKYVHIECVVW